MCKLMISQIISFIFGIIASLLVWFLTAHVTQVKIEFPEKIYREVDMYDKSKHHYNIEVFNVGKRALIDLHMQARISIEGADKKNPKLRCFSLLNLDHNSCNFPWLPSKNSEDKEWPRMNSGRLIYAIEMKHAYQEFSKIFYEEDIREKAKRKTLQLDDIFNTYPDAAIQFYLFGYDGFTGARKMFKSKYYREADVDGASGN